MNDKRLESAKRYHDKVTAERKLTAKDIALLEQLLNSKKDSNG